MITFVSLQLVLAFSSSGGTPAKPLFSAERAGFVVQVGDEVIPYRVTALPVLPGESLEIGFPESDPDVRFHVFTPDGEQHRAPSAGWSWTAPAQTGLYPLRVQRVGTVEEITLQVFVMVPLDQVRDGSLNGYRIGAYPAEPLRGLAVYEPPPGLIEVTEENADTPVSPHFRLGQFVCKQAGGYPKYVALRTRLLLKLELLLQEVNVAGFQAHTFHVMSGYRTPYYNAAIGNVRYSRHVWGDAADIFIDEAPSDGVMDDLNRDGTIDRRDAIVLHRLVEGLTDDPRYTPFIGGLGLYGTNASHGPFIHVDTRGFRARW